MSCITTSVAIALTAALLGGAAKAADTEMANTPSKTSYRVQGTWPMAGPGGWNRLAFDARNKDLYVTRGERVLVIDAASGREIGNVSGFQNAHAVALSADGKYGYATDGTAGTVHVFEQSTLRPIVELPAGKEADAVVFDVSTNTALVLNDRSNDATVIDEASNSVVARIALPGRPTSAALDENGNAFVSLNSMSAIVRIDMRLRQVTATWTTGTCEGPEAIAVDGKGKRVFALCDNDQLAVFDAATGNMRSSAAVEEGARDLVMDRDRQLLFAANGGGTLSVIRSMPADKLKVLQVVPTQPGARTMALNTATGQVFLPTADFGQREGVSEELQFRPTMVANSFRIVIVGEGSE